MVPGVTSMPQSGGSGEGLGQKEGKEGRRGFDAGRKCNEGAKPKQLLVKIDEERRGSL